MEYKFVDSRLLEIKKNIANNIKEEMKCKDLATVSDTMNVEKVRVPVLDGDLTKVSVVDEGGLINVDTFNAKYIDIPMKKYSIIVPITKEAVMYDSFDIKKEVEVAIARALHRKIDTDFFAMLNGVADEVATTGDGLDADISEVMATLENKDFNATNVVLGIDKKKEVRKIAQSNTNKDLVTMNNAYGCPITYQKGESVLALDKSQVSLILGQQMDLKVLEEGTLTLEDNSKLDLGQSYMLGIRVVAFVGMATYNNAVAKIGE